VRTEGHIGLIQDGGLPWERGGAAVTVVGEKSYFSRGGGEERTVCGILAWEGNGKGKD